MGYIEIAKSIKRDVEKVQCQGCEKSNVSFRSVLIEDDFMIEEGGYATVDAYCKMCRTYSAIVIKLIPTDEYLE